MANRTILRVNAAKSKTKKTQEVKVADPVVAPAPAVEKIEEPETVIAEAAEEKVVEATEAAEEVIKKPRRTRRTSRSKPKVQE